MKRIEKDSNTIKTTEANPCQILLNFLYNGNKQEYMVKISKNL